MDTREQLNAIYAPLHRAGAEALRQIRALGFSAALGYYNLHEVKVDGQYQTEYFPLPEIAIDGLANAADFGLTLDGTAWLELTLPREAALAADYGALAGRWSFEVYGAEDYLTDFAYSCDAPNGVKDAILASDETELHVNFPLETWNSEELSGLFQALGRAGLICPRL